MYVRNVKQAMRAADPGFDERKHGNLVEILRAVQRDGLVRLDRDRQGVLRVFQGPQLRIPAAPPQEPLDVAVEMDEPAAPPAPAPAEAAGFGLAAGFPPPVEPGDAQADAAPTVSETPDTGGPDAAEPAAEGTPRRRRKAGTAAPPQVHYGPQAAGARGHSAQEEDHGDRMTLSHPRPAVFVICAAVFVAALAATASAQTQPPSPPAAGAAAPAVSVISHRPTSRRRPQTPSRRRQASTPRSSRQGRGRSTRSPRTSSP